METRHQSVYGGNARPMVKPLAAKYRCICSTGLPAWKNTKLVCDGAAFLPSVASASSSMVRPSAFLAFTNAWYSRSMSEAFAAVRPNTFGSPVTYGESFLMMSGRATAKPMRRPARPWILLAVRDTMMGSPLSTRSVMLRYPGWVTKS